MPTPTAHSRTKEQDVTVVVRDLAAAKPFFGLLGLKEDKSVVIKGPQFSAYMGVEDIEAEHVTLVLADMSPRTEVQLLTVRAGGHHRGTVGMGLRGRAEPDAAADRRDERHDVLGEPNERPAEDVTCEALAATRAVLP